MTLYITIYINEDAPLETYYAHCIKIDKDNIGTYEIGKYDRYGERIEPIFAVLKHKRDRGASMLAWRTVKKVMEYYKKNGE